MLQCIPKIKTEEQNEKMIRLLDQDEVKGVVFELNGESACGPDGLLS